MLWPLRGLLVYTRCYGYIYLENFYNAMFFYVLQRPRVGIFRVLRARLLAVFGVERQYDSLLLLAPGGQGERGHGKFAVALIVCLRRHLGNHLAPPTLRAAT